MNLSASWSLTSAELRTFSSGVTFIVVCLMLFMAYRLYARNKRSGYRKLILSIGFSVLQQLYQIALAFGLIPQKSLLALADNVLYAITFILLNFAVFELYHKSRPRTQAWYYSLIGITLAISAGAVFTGQQPLSELWQPAALQSPVLDGFLVALCPLFALMFAPHIGQPRRYLLALIVSFALHLSRMLGRYIYPDATVYESIEALLTIAFFILLFMLLFDRVVELLNTAYRSAITDGLTHLFNRRFFTGQLERALKSGHTVGVIFCDIDNFKKLNDEQGHHQADQVLRQVAAILTEETEGSGLAGRYGGEELVAFALGSGAAAAAADRIRARIEKETIVTASIGYSQTDLGIPADTLIRQADEAMYHSKNTGKNRVTDYAAMSHAG
ncbi:GGDEF domain-containing protein [Cohnella lubricantis]|uniref:GGDEF domain-containing protein n=1 Tax=Cohnella lubricantis TaxID=2163172 RepID=A0A841TBI7_9BACL|nr:GGDEF domain-containing protein [Cohnella lubricantis]MBB6678833.1 GGDEF domain-containing protein [Cohnella lubricantis]MBP2118265.1 diguanylate cyclase (GGDEF)-like protein [Cohnella lubricantis]